VNADAALGRLEGRLHVMPLRVYYEDTDAAGIVYYANYLRFAERARSEFLRLLGIDQRALRERDGLVFAVRRAALDYLAPARLDDLLELRSTLTAVRAASVEALQRVLLDGHLLVDIRVQVAAVAVASGRAARLPAGVRRRLEDFCEPGKGE